MTPPDPQRLELKPCPFCGNAEIKVVPADFYEFDDVPQYTALCSTCATTNINADNEAEAAANWNRRALAAADAVQPTGRDEALRQAARDAITWHQEHRKALSKQPRADHWMMHQHQEQIDVLEAALATTTDAAGGGEVRR